MEYDEQLPFYYNNNQRFLQKKLDPNVIKKSKIFEKAEIRWFSIDEIKKRHVPFRSYYYNIADLIIKNELAIEKFVREKLRINHNKQTKTRRITKSKSKTQKRKMFSFLF
jgi:hypothetical protein